MKFLNKAVSPDLALAAVGSGQSVHIHPGCANPELLVQALLARAPQLRDVELLLMLTLGESGYNSTAMDGIFRGNAFFIGPNIRAAVQEGRADYTPIFLHQIEDLYLSGAKPVDVALVHCSPPDSRGYVSLGVGVDCTLTAARCARHVIAQVNPRMPRTCGETLLHLDQIHSLVEADHPLPELVSERADRAQERIAAHVASLIPDGATLQLGIGAIPDAVLSCLIDRKDLGLHTEMFSDGVMPLIERGVMNGARKTLLPNKLVAGFVLGTRRLFDFIECNPLFEFRPIRYVNHPFTVAQNENMVAINSAIQVDLTGQVCADSIGLKPYSGFGGQVDFIRGAAHSKGGKPVIALPSTAHGGRVSRIVPTLDAGAGVVTSRADVHYVVTEYGAAYLHGKTLRQRALSLIEIADPRFRDELYEFAVRARYLEPQEVCS
ncbi:MAG: acetyl-CoA hydrolase/transferase family protein [Acidimicrobiia bacterium]|nr:acetyl-CoA hydrolase/transferase family protein [Acidimicrobiia bacterium]